MKKSLNSTNVFVTNYVDFDLDEAWQFTSQGGSIIPITKGRINIFNIENLTRKIKRTLIELKETDWLIIAGNPIVSSLAVSMVVQKYDKINLLLWDARHRAYVPRKVSFKKAWSEEGINEPEFNK